MNTFHLPDLGEGLPEGEICKWHVKEGEFVKADDPLVSIETAKAVVEVPSPFTGKVAKLYGKEGDIIPTGAPLVDFEGEKKSSSTVAGEIKETNDIIVERATSVSARGGNVKALPAVRALAKKLNVDLNIVTPTGNDGTITADDVKKAHELFSSAGPIEPLKGVRRFMAIAMAQSHAEVVPVTVYDDADITDWVANKTFTERVLKALATAAQKEKSLNAWYDGQAMGRRVFDHVHIGVAMDTADGLFVPVIHDVQTKSMEQLRHEIEQLKQEVKTRTIAPEKMQGATIVLSNFGNFAGRYASPIIVIPTVAILAVGMIREAVWPINGEAKIRSVLPLSLTFDHRAVTGGEATRFLKAVIEDLK
jgi:2-oxoisovalerate dehydrogenase E2 component (dihydrolipoyl transacylase)